MSETDCEAVLKQVELYLDGELETVTYTEIEVHLTGCSSCMKRVEFRSALQRIVRAKCGSEPVPGDLMARIRDALREA
ncbi:MAG: mycothiol system anti-sigma-R factor [Actinobacteria bacterium]|nr:mycothiol system anti-sigma-R factor [Actinomycetota bacterium]